MKTWLVVQTIIDIILFFLVFLYLFNIKKKIAANKTAEADFEKLTAILESMNAIAEESERASERFVSIVESKEEDIKKLKRELDSEKKRLEIFLKEVRTQPHGTYNQVSLLFKKGLSVDDIARETDMSREEIELIKNIRR